MKTRVGQAVAAVIMTASLGLMHQSARAQVPAQLTACADEMSFPPFTHDLPGQRGTVVGYNMDVLDAILGKAGIAVNVIMRPWPRCLMMAKHGDIDILLDILDLPERREDVLITTSHYSYGTGLVTLGNRQGPTRNMPRLAQMEAIKLCELTSWYKDYSLRNFGVMPTGAPHDLQSAVIMLQTGRCDAGVYVIEGFVGGLASRSFPQELADVLSIQEIPDFHTRHYHHFGVVRNKAYSAALHQMLDSGIARLRADGSLTTLLGQYLPESLVSRQDFKN